MVLEPVSPAPTLAEQLPKELPDGKLFEGVEPAPQAAIKAFRSVENVGRQRKYEETGIYGALSVRQVIVYRKKMKRYPPDLSAKMQAYYDFWYFTKPSRKKDGADYGRHVESYNRGQRWLAAEADPSALGTGNVTDITSKRRAIRS